MANSTPGGTLGWWRLGLLQLSLVIATAGLLASTERWTLPIWIVAAVIQAGILGEAARVWRRGRADQEQAE